MSKQDRVRIGSEVRPGVRVGLRRNENGDSAVLISEAKDGDPVLPGQEIADVGLTCHEGWHDLTTIYRSGPPQVATPAYREGYDRIFGKKPEVGEA